MPRFFGKKGPRGGSRAGVKRRPKKNAPRRRLQPGLAIAGGLAVYGAKKVWDKRTRDYKKARAQAKRLYETRVAETDGVSTAPSIVIGKQKVITFQEKVARTVRPPFLWKRNFQFSAECLSGRKAFFCMEANLLTTADLGQDISAYKQILASNTGSADPAISLNTFHDGAQFYIDNLTEKIKMVNSSSNSITGKLHLIAYKRDVAGNYGSTGAIINPINMAMYYSTLGGISALSTGFGSEVTVGNGWAFNTSTAGSDYGVTYNMPGATNNPTGVCASTDPAFSLFGTQVKSRMNFWFRPVKTTTFSLKPGQQINQNIIFNDLPVIHRELQEYTHCAGISYSIVCEFTGGIVGDTLSSTISTGTCQLSVVRESTRILGLKNYLKPNVVLQTAPLTTILASQQVILNSDTGVALSGAVFDS